MPLHSFPHFVATEAIRADKIDEVVQALASRLNGGLDATSLATGVAFALSQFWEQHALCPVYTGAGLGVDDSRRGVVVPISGYIVGVSAALQSQLPRERQLLIVSSVSVIYTAPATVRGDSLKGRRAFDLLVTPIAVAAGDRIQAGVESISTTSGTVVDNRSAVLLAFPHQT
jgi:hypothetical protein